MDIQDYFYMALGNTFWMAICIGVLASPVAQLVKNPPAMQETWVQFLGWEDTLEKETAIYYSILAWRIP